MSQQQYQHQQQSGSNISVIEVYWTLVAKADKKFSKIREFPYNNRSRYDTYFYKVFKVYTQLWKFQQENRHKLVEAGLKRWEIGDIASRIGQLYFGQYMRTSEASYLSESFIFYEAVLTREYFKEGMFQDLSLVNKQLRFLARFLAVCLVLNRREMANQLINQLKVLLEECKKIFQETDFKEWKQVVQEIVKFMKADTAFMNTRPLRYSVVIDPHPDYLPVVISAKRKLRLKDAILCSYYPSEVKFSELTLDTLRMLQCLEWEPSGSFYKPSGTGINIGQNAAPGINIGQNAAPGISRISILQDISDSSLPSNPRKAILYRPSVTHFMAVLAEICEELPSDGVCLIYLSALGSDARFAGSSRNTLGSFQSQRAFSDATSSSSNSSSCEGLNAVSGESRSGSLHIGGHGNEGLSSLYPSDLTPFTRKPLFLVIESDCSKAFKVIHGAEKGELVAMLLSPSTHVHIPALVDAVHHPSGSLFTSFLTAPLQAFLLLVGFMGSDVQMEKYAEAEKLLSSSFNDWGSILASLDSLDAVWAQVLCDPFLRRLILRFIFCRAVLAMYTLAFSKSEFLPECLPLLPDAVLPMAATLQRAVLQIAKIFNVTNSFVFLEGINDYVNQISNHDSNSAS